MANSVSFTSSPNPHLPQIEDITPHELNKHLKDVYLVDVRTAAEYSGELGHIPGAKLMTLDTIPQKISTLPQHQTIVFVCKAGGRSAQATAFARQAGFKTVFNMQGGMMLWNELGLQVEK